MAKFIFLTQSSRTATYDGPSGERYVINLRQPFIVSNKDDVEFFKKNKRFKKVGLIHKVEPEKEKDELLEEELSQLEGISQKTVKKITDLYMSKEHLTEVVEQGYELDISIPKKQQEIIKDYVLKKTEEVEESEEEDKKDEEGEE